MIFVTVGHQTPFDRLVRAVDRWAADRGRTDVFAQVGHGEYVPSHMDHTRFLAPEAFRERFERARLVVGHAGTGTILTALDARKPLLVMPRRAALRETRNDHQLATARRFGERGLLTVAWDEQELTGALDRCEQVTVGAPVSRWASDELLEALRGFIKGD